MNPRSKAILKAAAVLPLAACAVNPATGGRQLSLISEGQEIQMGREADPQIRASMGLVDDPDLQAYVSRIGLTLATSSERPNLPWSFAVVDDPTVNAFALPGGFIYVTRGILAHFENEAELAGVIGHEIGHVTARHSVSQISRQQLQSAGLGIGSILSPGVAYYGNLLGAGLGILNLRYSRGDESQSDELGVRYMSRVGYDPGALLGVFDMLARTSGRGSERVPEWQLTHPYPESRAADIDDAIAKTPGARAADRRERDAFLERIDGLVFGDDPRQGYFKDGWFLHPELAFQLVFPSGWNTVNQRDVVGAVSPERDAVVVLELAERETDPEVALRAFLGQQGIRGEPIRESGEGGIPRARAGFSASSQQGNIRGEALFLKHRGLVFRILGYAPSNRWSSRSAQIERALSSFATVTDPRVLEVQPHRIEVVAVEDDMTFREFYQRSGSPVTLEELARLNRRDPREVVVAGTRLKRVVGEPLP